ncbi:MAG: hypothetical protein VXX36_08565, partial [Verrucomicrobiota bacterium]|nr:hypothetical protein [Verrucomicrobiota bacterium]
LKICNSPKPVFVFVTIQIEQGTICGEQPSIPVFGKKQNPWKMVKKQLKSLIRLDPLQKLFPQFNTTAHLPERTPQKST